MELERLKEQLAIAEKKLAFYKKKQLTGGLSLDQEFALEEDIEQLNATIAELNQQINSSKNSSNSNEKSTVYQTHSGDGDNVGGNKVITNNYYTNNNNEPSKSNTQNAQRQEVLSLIDKDLDKAFDMLQDKFENNPTYLDLVNEYISQPNNFSKANFRSKLKAFIRMNWR